jgi:1-acyl-sn-glycerol-3-phosphate acyltransferase
MPRSAALRPLRSVNSEPAEPALVRVVGTLNVGFKRLTDRDWRDIDKIPKTGGVIFVVNHISNIDPIAVGQFLAYGGRWPRFLGKSSLFTIPVVGKIITACGQIPVERSSRAAGQALAAAISAVREGKSVVIYPEGTITLDPKLWPMAGKTGAARVSLATGCPVVPIGQWGAHEVMPGKKPTLPRFFPRKMLRLKAGDPVPLDDLRAKEPTSAVLREATDRIMQAITALVADLRDEPPPPVRYDATKHGPAAPDDLGGTP